MTYWNRNDFEKLKERALIRVGSWSNGKRKGKVYFINKKENEECGMEYEREAYDIRFKHKLK